MSILASLTNRIFIATAGLVVLSIVAAMFVVNIAVTNQAENELRRGLDDAARLVEDHRTQLFEHFAREARLVADLPRLKAAVGTDHPPTVEPVASDYRQRIGADLFIVANGRGAVLAAIGEGGTAELERVVAADATEPDAGQEATWFQAEPSGVLQVVSTPIWIDTRQPELLGRLTVGFSLDRAAVEQFKQLTDSEVAIVVDGAIAVSTLDPGKEAALSRILEGQRDGRVRLGEEDFVAVTRPLAAIGGVGALGSTPVAVVLRSRTARLQFLRPLQTALVVTALVALLVAPLLSFVVARTVTRPLGTMTAAMREMAATGDLSRRIPLSAGKWEDEDTRVLGSTFNGLLESISRFQREAGQRERLSALGRLATVVAHEVRNPLMIIKATLAMLGKHDASPERTRAAIQDIDEEVTRLNRVVYNVLDFARPISFDLEQVDLNELCREAAGALTGGNGAAKVRLTLGEDAGVLRTDRERLRLVLVNLLNNSRHAVEACSGAGRAGYAAIEVRTAAAGEGDVVVEIEDQGIGVASGDVARIFEPYFTTKRTGTGLGLPISKQIIEGLGGTIRAQSDLGKGTTMRIELPRQPASDL